MSLVDLALLPIRVGLGIADAVFQAVTPASPAPPSELVVIDGMPVGVPAAALRPEPGRPAFSPTFPPVGWCRRAARTSTPPGLRPATAPTSSASPSGTPRPTRGG